MSEPSAPASTPPPAKTDLYCLNCGYNLRGLSGDPRRCPECGRFSSVADLMLPAWTISQQLRKMETWPTLCVASVLLAGWTIGFIALAMAFVGVGELETAGACCAFLLVPSAAVCWVLGRFMFRRSCLDKPGWQLVFWRFQLTGVLLCSTAIVAILAVPSICTCIPAGTLTGSRQADRVVLPLIGLSVLLPGAAVLLLYTRRAYRYARQGMEALQREVAVEMARRVHRKKVSRLPFFDHKE